MKSIKQLRYYVFLIILATNAPSLLSQAPADSTMDTAQTVISVDEMTREEIMNLTYDELLQLPLESLLKICEKLGVTMDDLLSTKIKVASNAPLTQRESPSILTVITEEEIRNSGVRDMTDLLNLVPGFSFANDIDGIVGVSMRGMWANEGKMLMLIDGQEIPELVFNGLQWIGRYNISEIKRIEIIRGPGSAIYGGNAELGVINIITKQGRDINGISVNTTYGQMTKMTGRRSVDIAAGKKLKDLEFALTGQIGDGTKSDGIAENIFNNDAAADLTDGAAKFKNGNIHANMKYKDMEVKYIYNRYQPAFPYDSSIYLNNFTQHNAEIKYTCKLTDRLTMTPRINETYSAAYNESDYDTNGAVNRIMISDVFKYDVNKTDYFLGGVNLYNDHFYNYKDFNADPAIYDSVQYNNFYNAIGFVEFHGSTKIVDITLGGRMEYHNIYGLAYAPRIGLTKVIKNFHFKLLASKAYRTPSFGNISHSMDETGQFKKLTPEDTYVFELELGYRLNENMFLTSNFFNINNKRNITYWDNGDPWGYVNGGRTGSAGVEVDYRLRYRWGFLSASYSYYLTSARKNTVGYYAVPVDSSYFLASPKHKIALLASFNITEHFTVSPSVVYFGKRYAYDHYDPDTVESVSLYDPSLLINLYLSYKDLFIKGLTFGVGVYDILNQKPKYMQAYQGNAVPFPGPSREIIFRLTYNFKFKEE